MQMNSYLSEKIRIKSTNINFLRFICAIAVIICHSYAISTGEEDFVSRLTKGQANLGAVAVAVFFFLSGLYVSKSLDKAESAFSFLKRRCERIFPQLWLVVLLSIALGAVITTLSPAEYFGNAATYKYLLNGILIPVHDLPGVFVGQPYSTVNGPLWTMSVEFGCYIGLAAIALLTALLFRKKTSRKLPEILTAAGLLAAFGFFRIRMPESMMVSVARAGLLFFEGVLYYEYRERIILNPYAAGFALMAFAALALTPIFNLGLILLFPYAFLGMTLGLPQIKNDFKLFSISYEMYLVGWPIQQTVRMIAGKMSPTLNWLITLPFDIIIGWILIKVTKKKEKQEKILMDERFNEIMKQQSEALNKLVENGYSNSVSVVVDLLLEVLKRGNKIMIAGNGGSAADAQHFAAELVGRFLKERNGYPAIALTTDSSILTSIGNDYGYEELFSRQINALGKAGDAFIGISTSGNSENIIKAFTQCKNIGIRTVALLGRDGGRIKNMADYIMLVPLQETPRIQEIHTMTVHMICEMVEIKMN